MWIDCAERYSNGVAAYVRVLTLENVNQSYRHRLNIIFFEKKINIMQIICYDIDYKN